MSFPVQVSFQQMAPSAPLRARIRELAARLERFSPNILRCRVRVERPPQHRQQGGLHDIRIDITVPDEQIVIRHSHPLDHAHEDAYVALRDAFNAARRQLEDYEHIRRGRVKRHRGDAQPAPKRPRAVSAHTRSTHGPPVRAGAATGSTAAVAATRSRRR